VNEKQYTLEIEAKAGHLFARASGPRTRASVTAITVEVFDAAVAHGLSKALIDVTELEGRLGILDSFLLVTEVFQRIRGRGVSRAAIVDRSVPSLGERFLETVARNRAFNFRIFADEEDALEWLNPEGLRRRRMALPTP
jgi:hypothetical protein